MKTRTPMPFLLLSLLCGMQKGMAQAVQPMAKFPTAAQATLKRLDDCDHLPGGVWRYHAADMPHREDPAVDDASWPIAESGNDLDAEALGSRWIGVPKTLDGYDLTVRPSGFMRRSTLIFP